MNELSNRARIPLLDKIAGGMSDVSVHVSNILAKLGVSGRDEAAALAHQARLFDDEEPVRRLA